MRFSVGAGLGPVRASQSLGVPRVGSSRKRKVDHDRDKPGILGTGIGLWLVLGTMFAALMTVGAHPWWALAILAWPFFAAVIAILIATIVGHSRRVVRLTKEGRQ